MENIDQLVQFITDRLLVNLEEAKQGSTLYLIGDEELRQSLLVQGYQLQTDGAVADELVIDQLGLDALLRIASLSPIEDIERLVLNRLLNGQRVLISEKIINRDHYQQTARPSLYRELMRQKEKLASYGVVFYQPDQLPHLLSDEVKKSQVRSTDVAAKRPSSSSLGQNRLITEAKLKAMALAEGDVFQLEKGMIITALAKDYLKRQKVKLVK